MTRSCLRCCGRGMLSRVRLGCQELDVKMCQVGPQVFAMDADDSPRSRSGRLHLKVARKTSLSIWFFFDFF